MYFMNLVANRISFPGFSYSTIQYPCDCKLFRSCGYSQCLLVTCRKCGGSGFKDWGERTVQTVVLG